MNDQRRGVYRRRSLNLGPSVTGRVQIGIHLSPRVLQRMDEAASRIGGRSNFVTQSLTALHQADPETRQVLIEREVYAGRSGVRGSSLSRINVRLDQEAIQCLHQLLADYRREQPTHDVEQAHIFRAAVNCLLAT